MSKPEPTPEETAAAIYEQIQIMHAANMAEVEMTGHTGYGTDPEMN